MEAAMGPDIVRENVRPDIVPANGGPDVLGSANQMQPEVSELIPQK